jgi:hypothetical protein
VLLGWGSYRRYAIVAEADLAEGLTKLAGLRERRGRAPGPSGRPSPESAPARDAGAAMVPARGLKPRGGASAVDG